MSQIRELANGRWRDILPALGIDARFLANKHGPCPMCDGKDRFRWDDKGGDGTFYCSHCGAGDGLKLVMLRRGETFLEAVQAVESVIGAAPATRSRTPAHSEVDRVQQMNALWASGMPAAADNPAGRYLTRRTGQLPVCGDLRAVPAMRHATEGQKVVTITAGLIALVRGPDGAPVNLHRTYLTADGRKAAVEPVRKMMAGPLPPGSAIRLAPAGVALGVAEGIETALSASLLFGVPVWAAITADGLRKFTPPAGVDLLMVFGDCDPNYVGQAAAYDLAKRLHGKLAVEVMLPRIVGEDWNDELQRRRVAA